MKEIKIELTDEEYDMLKHFVSDDEEEANGEILVCFRVGVANVISSIINDDETFINRWMRFYSLLVDSKLTLKKFKEGAKETLKEVSEELGYIR